MPGTTRPQGTLYRCCTRCRAEACLPSRHSRLVTPVQARGLALTTALALALPQERMLVLAKALERMLVLAAAPVLAQTYHCHCLVHRCRHRH